MALLIDILPNITNICLSNNDISNNYSGMKLTNQFLLDYPNSYVLDSSENTLKLYSNVEEIDNATIEKQRNYIILQIKNNRLDLGKTKYILAHSFTKF